MSTTRIKVNTDRVCAEFVQFEHFMIQQGFYPMNPESPVPSTAKGWYLVTEKPRISGRHGNLWTLEYIQYNLDFSGEPRYGVFSTPIGAVAQSFLWGAVTRIALERFTEYAESKRCQVMNGTYQNYRPEYDGNGWWTVPFGLDDSDTGESHRIDIKLYHGIC